MRTSALLDRAPNGRTPARCPSHPLKRSPTTDDRLDSAHLRSAAGNLATLRSLGIRAKLETSQASDLEEQEADRLAETFVRRKAQSTQPILAHSESRSGALTPAVRREYEDFFGEDLSALRVHAGGSAQAAARALSAQAFTIGNDVYFGLGRFAPDRREGRRLLAHEVAHVARHRGSAPAVRRQEEAPPRSDRRATDYRRIEMRFTGSELIVYGDGTELFRYSASSGRPIEVSEEDAGACGGDARVDTYMSPRFTGIRSMGPIPEGEFRFSPPRIQEFSTGEQLDLLWGGLTGDDRVTIRGQSIHAGDWGAGRVALQPVRVEDAPCGNPRARGGFYLHGGLLAGSSGCIDIGTSFDELAAFLRDYRRKVTIEVRYKEQTPRVGFLTGLGGALAYQGFHFRHGPTLRLGVEFGSTPARFVASTEYQAVLDWAGGALAAGLHVDIPMNSEEAFVRAGLRGSAEFRLLHALYGQLSAGGFVESTGAAGGTGYELGAGLQYDFGPAQLGVVYNLLRSTSGLDRNQMLAEIGFRW